MSTVFAPEEQLCLFERGIDVVAIRRTQEELMSCMRSVNTRRAYRYSWAMFCRWCSEAGRSALPATPETVSLFVAWCFGERKLSVHSVRVHAAAVGHHHLEMGLPSPVEGSVRSVIAGAARAPGRRRGAPKAALAPEQLRRMCRRLLSLKSPIAVRDRALLLVTFAAGWRRSEMASLDLSDVRVRDGALQIRLGRSKTDQEGQGREVLIEAGRHEVTCPVRALEAWLALRGSWRGSLFVRVTKSGKLTRQRLGGASVCRILKRYLGELGEDAAAYGAHSLRSGMATAAAEQGASEIAIMRRGGWRSMDTVLRYVQAFRSNPLAGVL